MLIFYRFLSQNTNEIIYFYFKTIIYIGVDLHEISALHVLYSNKQLL